MLLEDLTLPLSQSWETLDKVCSLDVDQNVKGNLDTTPLVFDNQYFKELVFEFRLNTYHFPSNSTVSVALQYSNSRDQSQFFYDFVNGMCAMGDLQLSRMIILVLLLNNNGNMRIYNMRLRDDVVQNVKLYIQCHATIWFRLSDRLCHRMQ